MMRSKVDLSLFDNSAYNPGRPLLIRAVWHVLNALLLGNALIPSFLKGHMLRLFGAHLGAGIVLKPGINIKYPWNLRIGDNSWIGENVWIDSLAPIEIGSNVCISQGAYLCAGSHDITDNRFGLIVRPIIVEAGSWICAGVIVLPGVTVASHSVISAGSVVARDTVGYTIYSGNPAAAVRERVIG